MVIYIHVEEKERKRSEKSVERGRWRTCCASFFLMHPCARRPQLQHSELAAMTAAVCQGFPHGELTGCTAACFGWGGRRPVALVVLRCSSCDAPTDRWRRSSPSYVLRARRCRMLRRASCLVDLAHGDLAPVAPRLAELAPGRSPEVVVLFELACNRSYAESSSVPSSSGGIPQSSPPDLPLRRPSHRSLPWGGPRASPPAHPHQ